MKKWVLLIILVLVGATGWYFWIPKSQPDKKVPPMQPVAVSRHSDSFNISLTKVLSDYYHLSEALVNWDSVAVATQATSLGSNMKAVNFNELKKDSTIYLTALDFIKGVQTQAETIAKPDISLQEKRVSFNQLSDDIYNLIRTIKYDQAKIYLQECPMALSNHEEKGVWLSTNQDIRNPYLGLHDPKYGKSMLECGETKDSLNYIQAQ